VPLIEEVKYVPLPARAYELAAKHFKEGKLGTGFGGVPEVGLKVEELLAREAKL
jgi:phosphate transport system substrate-binding protein